MPDDFYVDDGLGPHAGQFDQIAESLSFQVDTARLLALPFDAYGEAGQRFPELMAHLTETGTAALAHLRTTVRSVADGVRATATHYDQVDDAEADRFTSEGS